VKIWLRHTGGNLVRVEGIDNNRLKHTGAKSFNSAERAMSGLEIDAVISDLAEAEFDFAEFRIRFWSP